jgi:hypothetical protein
MTGRRIALLGSAVVALLAGYLVASAATPAVALTVVDRPVPVTVALTGGGTMTVPTVAGGEIAFDLTVPSLSGGSYVTPLAWTAAGTYWEVVVDSTSVYVQWSRGSQHGLGASAGQVDDGRLRHVRVDTRRAVLAVDGADVATVSGAPAAGPVLGMTLNPASH